LIVDGKLTFCKVTAWRLLRAGVNKVSSLVESSVIAKMAGNCPTRRSLKKSAHVRGVKRDQVNWGGGEGSKAEDHLVRRRGKSPVKRAS